MELDLCHSSFNISNHSSGRRIRATDFSDQIPNAYFLKLLTKYVKSHHGEMSHEQVSRLIELDCHHSAAAIFYALSDSYGSSGLRRERIRAVQSWHKGPAQYDTVFIRGAPHQDTISSGLTIGRVRAFLSFSLESKQHNCALIHKFSLVGTTADENTGMWIVYPRTSHSRPVYTIIPIHNIV